MTPPPVSVTVPVGQAIERVKQVLFRPFKFDKWFVIGFCAWLAYLGGGGGFNFRAPGGSHGDGAGIRHTIEQARSYVAENLYWIVPAAVVAVGLLLILGVVFLWLRSRGEFMFLHCVARNRAEVAGPWTTFAREGNSLFLFRLALGAVSVVVTWPLLILCGVWLFRMWIDSDWNVRGVLDCASLGLAFVVAGTVFAIAGKLTSDFVVPVMFLRRTPCLDCWREFWRLLTAQLGQFILYLLFQIVLAVALGILVVVVVLLTCCCAGCVLVLPYLGTVMLLPVLVFKRAYSLHYLAQYGSEFDVFAPPPAPPRLVSEPVPPVV